MIGICGASGLIGSVLQKEIIKKGETVLGTYCHHPKPGLVRFDLRNDDITLFDGCDFVFVLSNYKKIAYCEENKIEAFWLNVYCTVRLLNHLNKKGIPALFVSSDAAIKPELMETTYGKYKRLVERYIKEKNLKNCDFIQPGRINDENVEELARQMCEKAWARKGRKE